MKELISKRLSMVIVLTMLFVLLLNLFLQIESAQKNMEYSAAMSVERIEDILRSNNEDLLRLNESLKEGYIIRAKAVTYMMSNHPELDRDTEAMRKLAELLQVDEICLFDAEGTLYGGSHPEYFGFTMNDGEQISYFLPMLEDKSLALCQDVTPNTALGKPMMYAAVWCDDGKSIVQIGLEPRRILEAVEKNDISYIFSNLAVQEGATAFAIDSASGEILGSTNSQYVGKNSKEIKLVVPIGYERSFIARIDGVLSRCFFREDGEILIGVAWESRVLYRDLTQSMILVLLYLSVAAVMMLAAILRCIDSMVIDNIGTVNEKLQEIANGNLDTKVEVTSLPEFVSLSTHINQMTDSLLSNSVKISRVLDATDSQIGFFEYDSEKSGVLATRKVATILAIAPDEMRRLCADREQFEKRIAEICAVPVERTKNIYALPTETACYIKIETYVDAKSTFGIVMDVTEEILEKVRLRHERDHDLLTQLHSRRAFYRSLEELFAAPEKLGHAVMLMCDLDGLKGINDTCGHAGGDKAIREAAAILTSVEAEHKIVSRLSGDEFALFLYGAENREELQQHIDALYRNMMLAEITVFDKTIPVRLSGGYVFYPEYCEGYTTLLRKADQALYHSKGNGKAKFSVFCDEFEHTEVKF